MVFLLKVLKRVLETQLHNIKVRFSNRWFPTELMINSRFKDLFRNTQHLANNSYIQHVLHITLQISRHIHLLHQSFDGHGINNNLFVRYLGFLKVVSIKQHAAIPKIRSILFDRSAIHGYYHIVMS